MGPSHPAESRATPADPLNTPRSPGTAVGAWPGAADADQITARSTPTRVTNLELFFDLVFVYTITQVTGVIDHHPGWAGAAQGALILIILFWMYGGFAWLTNATGTSGTGRRLLVLAGMAALLVCSVCVPHAFDDDGIPFGIAYLVLTTLHFVGFLIYADPGGRRGMLVIGPINVFGAVLILISGWQHGVADWLIWIFVSVMYLSALVLTGRRQRFTIAPVHFMERHSLMIIIVLGESLVSVAGVPDGHPIDLRLILGVLCGLAASAGLWWLYFDDDEIVAGSMARTGPAHARLGVTYDLTHLMMMAGVIAMAAGTRLGLDDLLSPAGGPGAVLIAGGAAVFLLGTAAFRAGMRVGGERIRLVAAVAVLAGWPAGLGWGTGQALGVVAVVLAGTVLAERARPAEADRAR